MSAAGMHLDDPELKRIRWRCRRGMRELDQLFERYLAQRWPPASESPAPEEERGVFLQLLDCEDDKLWRWFMGYEQCPDVALASLIQRIRQLPP
jgi:antitoxin CptB